MYANRRYYRVRLGVDDGDVVRAGVDHVNFILRAVGGDAGGLAPYRNGFGQRERAQIDHAYRVAFAVGDVGVLAVGRPVVGQGLGAEVPPAQTGQDREEVLRKIMWEEPRPPRQLNPAIPADLETIVLKAMAKRAEDRYATARELAEDLRRFLEQKPIRARRPTLLERAAKWSRRHKTVVGSAVAVLVLSAVGFAVSTALIAREQANTRAAYHRLAEEQARTKAAYDAEARNFQQARRMLDFFAQVSAEELAELPEAQDVRRKLLEAALEYYQGFIAQCPDDPSTREELARSHLRVANLLNGMGATADALAALEQAHRILEKKPDPELQRLSSVLTLSWLRNGGPLLLLEQPSVREELKLTEEQTRQVGHLAARRRAAFWDSPDLSLERWRVKFEELAAQEKAVLDGLTPEQARRLKQIAWQEGGASAFSDPQLHDELALTDEQKAQIRAVQDEARRAMFRHMSEKVA